MNALFNELKCGVPRKLAENVKFFEKEFRILGDDCRGKECVEESRPFCFQVCISSCAQMLYLWHFGFRGQKLQPRKMMEKGVEMAETYFSLVCGRLAKAMRKMDWTKEIAWFAPYSNALLMTTLGGCTKNRQEFSDLLHPNLAVETVAIPIEPVLGDFLLCVAASFQSSPMDTAPLEEQVRKSRKQHPKLLLKAWQALGNQDRAQFASALADSVANFAKTTADDDRPMTAVAVLESILAAIAYERGWTDLSFELPIAARLVTPQSLELS